MTKEQTMKLTVLYVKALRDCVGSPDWDDKICAMRAVFDIVEFDYEAVERLYDETEED